MESLFYKLYYKGKKKGNSIKTMDDAVVTLTCMTPYSLNLKKSISEGFIGIKPLEILE